MALFAGLTIAWKKASGQTAAQGHAGGEQQHPAVNRSGRAKTGKLRHRRHCAAQFSEKRTAKAADDSTAFEKHLIGSAPGCPHHAIGAPARTFPGKLLHGPRRVAQFAGFCTDQGDAGSFLGRATVSAEARAPIPSIWRPEPITTEHLQPYASSPAPCPARSERTNAVSSLRVCTPNFW